MAAVVAHEPPWRISLQPPLVLAPVPDPILGSEHPAAPFAVEHGEIPHRQPKRPCLERARATLVDESAITRFGFGEWIDGHDHDSISLSDGVTERV